MKINVQQSSQKNMYKFIECFSNVSMFLHSWKCSCHSQTIDSQCSCHSQTIESVLLSFVNDVMCLLTLFLNILVVQNGFPNVVVIQNLETSGNHLPHWEIILQVLLTILGIIPTIGTLSSSLSRCLWSETVMPCKISITFYGPWRCLWQGQIYYK